MKTKSGISHAITPVNSQIGINNSIKNACPSKPSTNSSKITKSLEKNHIKKEQNQKAYTANNCSSKEKY